MGGGGLGGGGLGGGGVGGGGDGVESGVEVTPAPAHDAGNSIYAPEGQKPGVDSVPPAEAG